ncbi:DUF4817 domain-containing protein [Trichonephila clavipes]|nr:DUF4817 domain-containing protein [Trichonephila clavipes]
MGDFTYAENTDMHYRYGHANSNGRAAVRMHHAQVPDRRMPDHTIFLRVFRQLREKRSFHITRHDAGRRRTVSSPSLEESILNVVADRPESSTRAVAHYVRVSHQIVCRVLNENRLHPFLTSTSFESGRLSSSASGWYSNVRCSWTLAHVLNSFCKHCTCQRRFQ